MKKVVAYIILGSLSCMSIDSTRAANQVGLVTGISEEEVTLLEQLAIGSTYEHYSGKKYKVLGTFRHSEDLSLYVAYEGLYDPSKYGAYWIRPLTMFLETVVKNGIEQPRFKKIT